MVNDEKKECIFLGDLNIDLKKVDSCTYVNEFLEIF